MSAKASTQTRQSPLFGSSRNAFNSKVAADLFVRYYYKPKNFSRNLCILIWPVSIPVDQEIEYTNKNCYMALKMATKYAITITRTYKSLKKNMAAAMYDAICSIEQAF